MEKRAIIIVFDGNEPPKNIIERIVKEVTTWCEANPDHTSIYTLDEKDIVSTISKSFISANYVDQCKNGNEAIKLLNDEFAFKEEPTAGSFCIAVSLHVMHILDREHTNKITKRDRDVKKAIIMLGKGCVYDNNYALSLGYTSEFDKVIKNIYKRIFNEDGTFKK